MNFAQQLHATAKVIAGMKPDTKHLGTQARKELFEDQLRSAFSHYGGTASATEIARYLSLKCHPNMRNLEDRGLIVKAGQQGGATMWRWNKEHEHSPRL